MQKIPVYVISLARAPERRRAVAEHLTALGIEFEIFDAVDGRSLSPDFLKSVTALGVTLTPGMIGCNLSHLEVTKRLLASKADVALFLEDDARLNPRTRDLLVQGLDPSAFDICFLDCADYNAHGPVFYDRDDHFDLAGGFRAHRLSSGPQRTHAMLVTRAASESRIDLFLPIRNAIDVYTWQPPTMRFHAIISPKAAWLSEDSIESFTSPSGSSGADRGALFGLIRKGPLYYSLSDWISLTRPRRHLLAQLLKAEQVLTPGRRWSPLPPSGKVLG